MDPTRLLDDDRSRFEVQLLRTALRDEPPEGAMDRAAIALGVGATAGAVVTAAAAAKAATAGAGAANVAKVGALGIAKWVSIGLVSGLVVTGGLRVATDADLRAAIAGKPVESAKVQSAPARAGGARPIRMEARAEANVAPAPAEPTETPAREPKPMPARAAGVVAAPSPDPVTAQPAELARLQSLSVELAPLENARRALVGHDPGSALRELDVYGRTSRSGVLDAEAEILRIEALVQSGRVAEARTLAADALAKSPSGPHAARLRAVVGMR